MATISIEHLDDITVFSVSGQLCFDEFVDAIKNKYHTVTTHIIWDFTNGNLEGINQDTFRTVLSVAKECRPFNGKGKTAYVSTDDRNFWMTCLFAITANTSMPYPYKVFRTIDEAIKWMNS